MDKEQAILEAGKKLEGQEDREPARISESPEEVLQRIISESEKEVVGFRSEGEVALAQVEARATKEEVSIEEEDRKALLDLNQEADMAKAELLAEVGEENETADEGKRKNENLVQQSETQSEAMGKLRDSWFEQYYSEATTDEERSAKKQKVDLQYSETKEGIENLLKILPTEGLEREKAVQEVAGQIDLLRKNNEELKRSRISHFFNFNAIRKNESEIKNLMQIKEDKERGVEVNRLRVEELKNQLADDIRLREAEAKLFELYGGTREAWEKLEKKENEVDLAQVAKEQEAYFIHGIRSSHLGDQAATMEGRSDWKTKMEICLALDPTISVSSLKRMDNLDNMWSRTGFVLNGGRAQDAGNFDLWTSIDEQGKRKRGKNVIGGDNQIDGTAPMKIRSAEAIKNRPQNMHNEFIVADPKIAGIYKCIDEEVFDDKDNWDKQVSDVSDKELYEFANKQEVPLFVISRGTVLKARYDQEQKRIMPLEDGYISPADLISGEGYEKKELADSKKEEIIEGILADSPFEINPAEMELVNSVIDGEFSYCELNVNKIKESIQKGGSVDLKFIDGNSFGYKINEKGMLVREHKYSRNGQERVDEVDEESIKPLAGARVSGGAIVAFEKAVASNEDYLLEVEKAIANRQEEKDFKKNEGKREWMQASIDNLLANLYGFGKQAEKMGDLATRDRAWELVSKAKPIAEIQQMMDKRYDEGKLKMTREELNKL